jgi:hypothetical protein
MGTEKNPGNRERGHFMDESRVQGTDITFPELEALKLRAIEERNTLHVIVGEFRRYVAESREKLSLTRNVRKHLAAVSLATSLVALLSGYGLAGIVVNGKASER